MQEAEVIAARLKTLNVSALDVLTLIPQRPPFVMVDRLLSCDLTDSETMLTLREDNVFMDDGEFSAAGIMENMAQSCAARIGCINMMRSEMAQQGGQTMTGHTIGVIGDIRDCVILRQPRLGETLHTHIQIIEQMMNLTLTELTTRVEGETIATARLKIALAEAGSGE